MGVTGIHLEVGLSTSDLEEAHVKRALIASAAETIVLGSSEKLNAASKYVIAPISHISGLITEKAVPSSVIAPFRKLGLTVTRA